MLILTDDLKFELTSLGCGVASLADREPVSIHRPERVAPV